MKTPRSTGRFRFDNHRLMRGTAKYLFDPMSSEMPAVLLAIPRFAWSDVRPFLIYAVGHRGQAVDDDRQTGFPITHPRLPFNDAHDIVIIELNLLLEQGSAYDDTILDLLHFPFLRQARVEDR